MGYRSSRQWYRLILTDGYMMLEGPSKDEVLRAHANQKGSHVETCWQHIYFSEWTPMKEDR